MANNCYFAMKIAGEKENVEEFIQMLQWQGPFENRGLGRVFSFEVNDFEPEVSENNNLVAMTGSGDCAWSIFSAMCAESRGDLPSLESETRRLNLAVEVYSSEPGIGFQEHYLINRGDVIKDECIDYSETWTLEMSEEDIQEFCEENEISREHFDQSINENGDYTTGGYGDQFGDFEDLFSYFESEQEKSTQTYAFTDSFGDVYLVKPYIDRYRNNDNLFIGLMYLDPEVDAWCPYSDITVNITSLPYMYSAVDTSLNEKGTLQFLQENGFGKDIGQVLYSGFNQYPVFHFDEDKVRAIDPKTFDAYAKAKGHIPKDKPSLESKIKSASDSPFRHEPSEPTKDDTELSK